MAPGAVTELQYCSQTNWTTTSTLEGHLLKTLYSTVVVYTYSTIPEYSTQYCTTSISCVIMIYIKIIKI